MVVEKETKGPEAEVVENKEPTKEELAQAEADFESGFAAERDPPSVKDTPKPKVEAKTEAVIEKPDAPKDEPKKADPAPDPWAGVPQVVKESLQSITSAFPRFEQELKTTSGRVGALQSAFDAAKATTKTGAEAPTAAQIAQAAPSSKKWTELKEDFPQWADAVDERLASESDALSKKFAPQQAVDVDAIRQQVLEEMKPVMQQSALEAREAAKLDLKHDGWEELVKTPEFKTWHDAQPADVKRLVDSPYFKDADRLLSAYSAAQKQTEDTQRRQARLEAAAPAPGVTAGGPPVLSDADAFADGFYSTGRYSR